MVLSMVFNTTFNNISVISWRSVLLVEETGENHWTAASHCQTWIYTWSSRQSKLALDSDKFVIHQKSEKIASSLNIQY